MGTSINSDRSVCLGYVVADSGDAMTSFVVASLEQAIACNDDELDLAIVCIVNAMCCRENTASTRRELTRILCEMQKKQRAIWRGEYR
jgi:hypothetical protein